MRNLALKHHAARTGPPLEIETVLAASHLPFETRFYGEITLRQKERLNGHSCQTSPLKTPDPAPSQTLRTTGSVEPPSFLRHGVGTASALRMALCHGVATPNPMALLAKRLSSATTRQNKRSSKTHAELRGSACCGARSKAPRTRHTACRDWVAHFMRGQG